MPLVLADRVKETTTTAGTGTVTLAGASTGYQSFAVVGNGNTTYYCIAGQTTSEWEVGIGTYTSAGTTLARTTVLSNSAGTQPSALSFSAGTKDVFVTYPSGRSVNLDASSNLVFSGVTAQRFQADFTNATVNSRYSFQTSTANSTTGIYALPNGTSTAASWQATNAADPTNASKVLIATNGTTDVQLVSGINGTGSYLPLSFYNGGVGRFVIGTSGQFGIGPAASVSYGTSGQVLTSGGSGAPPTWSSPSSGTASFVATGAISNGVTVGLRSDGTIEPIALSTVATSVGTAYNGGNNGYTNRLVSAYSSVDNKYLIVWTDALNSNYMNAQVATVSGNTISFGSTYTIQSLGCSNLAVAYIPTTSTFGIVYRNTSNNYGYGLVATISGTVVSVGSAASLGSLMAPSGVAFTNTGSTFIVAATESSVGNYSSWVAGFVTGGTLSVNGSLATISGGSTANSFAGGPKVAIDQATNNIIYVYRNTNSWLTYISGTMSGANVTWGTPVNNATVITGYSCADPVFVAANKFFVGILDTASTATPKGVVGTISSNAVTMDATVVSFTTTTTTPFSCAYNAVADRVVLTGIPTSGSQVARYAIVSVSGTTPTIVANWTDVTATTNWGGYVPVSASTTSPTFLMTWGAYNSSVNQSVVFTATYSSTNAANYIGVAAQAISNGATGSVTIAGGVNTGVSGLTVNSKYYVQANGTLSTTNSGYPLVGRGLSATSILVTNSLN